ncbi:GNAT family N-acetyltransferase, partial [Nocardia wallacei]|uniref:GNAT family N-acetyltransferase n=1 Tax=Nocardia wallacei TaxID=480035 RepID=UPI00313B7358
MSDIPVIVDRAGLWDAEALSDVAAATFPLACPPELALEDIDTFIARILSGDRFGDYLSDPGRTVLKAVAGGAIVGYAMLVAGPPAEPEMAAAMGESMIEINKLYVLPDHHGAGVGGGGGGGGGGGRAGAGGGGGGCGGWWGATKPP